MAFFPTEGDGILSNLPNLFMAQPGILGRGLSDEEKKKLQGQANLKGLVGAGLTYLAQPKTENYGSAIPYLAKAYLGGMNSAQDVYDQLGKKNSPFGAIDPSKFTPDSLERFIVSGKYSDLEPVTKAENLPTSRQEFDLAAKDPAYMKFLRDKWDAENKARRAEIATEEANYKFGTPGPTINPPKFATMQDVADTAKKTGKTTDQVIKDLKAKNIEVRTK